MHEHRRTRYASRTRPLVRRRDGRVEVPRDPWSRSSHDLALSVGWRPQG
ncbi:hypothetical protein [Nocardioides taihuensis]|uniref:Uncharacterized protein n=1 Tax=Nocardioides taihuensis TaxID=1835606 RepID=A0ABW0BHC4_9ACTN